MITSWNFAATGVIFSCSSIFQGLGNTWPVSGSSALRLVAFLVPAVWVTSRPGFTLDELWYLSVATMFLQAGVSYLLLRREFGRKLGTFPVS